MRRILVVALLALAVGIPVATSSATPHGYAQIIGAPLGDEFNSNVFASSLWHVICAAQATQPCPDAQSSTTWSLDANNSGQLRIWTQFGSLFGTPAQASNNARNMVLQPFDPATDWTITTKLAFPANSAFPPVLAGQTAGLLVYQNDDNFIYLSRNITSQGTLQLQFTQEVAGVDLTQTVPETGLTFTVYLRLAKTGTLYQASYSYDNVNFVPISAQTTGTATATVTNTPTGTTTTTPGTATPTGTAVPTGYSASFTSPQVGLAAFGGTDSRLLAAGNTIPADFDWFRVGNSTVPAATPLPTSTGTVSATSTSTSTPVTATTTATTATATTTPATTATATSTPVPTPTPVPVVRKPSRPSFQWVSLWYHVVRIRTFDVINFQGKPHSKMGIWAHVNFPSGIHYDYYQQTDKHGHWLKRFTIPKNAISKHSNRANITLQLWHGKRTRKSFVNFTVIR